MQILKPQNLYSSPRYYPAVKAGGMIFVAGRIPVDTGGNVVAPGDAAAQTEQIMRDLELILAEGGATLQDVVMVHTYFLEEEDMPAIHDARQRFMGGHYPPHTGTKTESASWRERGIRLEIEVIAVAGG